jgi:hypothetical protein
MRPTFPGLWEHLPLIPRVSSPWQGCLKLGAVSSPVEMILCRTILVLNHGIPCPWVTVYGLYDPEGPKSIQLPLVLVSTNVWQVRLLQTLNMLCNLSLQARNMFTERPEFEAQGA